ncbi:MAG: sulfotransferase [Pseudomonadota bacterium]|nr:sulfotransferase [Pseudomonadota bacterium]
MLPLAPRIPPLLRLANHVGGALRRLVPSVGGLDPDSLVRAATRRTGLTDFGPDDAWREALQVYTASLQTDAHLHFFGRIHLRDVVIRTLVDRLLLQKARPTLPPLERAPLVVCGLPRSGTTFLHRMLSEPEDTRALPLWELMEPIPGPGADHRLARARRRLARLRTLTPMDLDAIHLIRAELPDECSYLLKSSFRSAMLWQAPAIGWLDWHLSQPATDAYQQWRDWIRLLSAPGKRLVLKDPFHVAHLPELFAAVPNAMVVRTHRDPLETLPSYHKLCLNMHAVLCDPLDAPAIVEANTRWQVALANAAVNPGAGVPAARVLDIDYRQLVADPVGTMRHIHGHFGLEWDASLAACMAAYVHDNGQRKFGENAYTIGDFGQSEADLRRRFAPYREAFRLGRDAAAS